MSSSSRSVYLPWYCILLSHCRVQQRDKEPQSLPRAGTSSHPIHEEKSCCLQQHHHDHQTTTTQECILPRFQACFSGLRTTFSFIPAQRHLCPQATIMSGTAALLATVGQKCSQSVHKMDTSHQVGAIRAQPELTFKNQRSSLQLIIIYYLYCGST